VDDLEDCQWCSTCGRLIMGEITLESANDPGLQRRVIVGLADKLGRKEGCAFCLARALLREAEDYAARCLPGSARADRTVDELARYVRGLLAHEPTVGVPACRACRRVRATAPLDKGMPCRVHALCAEHAL